MWKIFAAIALLIGGLVAGAALSAFFSPVRTAMYDLKRETRLALGLPKIWVRAPTPDPSGRQGVPCPAPGEALVIVSGGQSNAANSNSALDATTPDERVMTWFDGACYATEDPVLGATSLGGSLWPAFGRALVAESGRPVLFLHTAVGGTQVVDWLAEESGYLNSLRTRVEGLRAAGHEPDWILWHQGETDANVIEDGEAFRAALTDLSGQLLEIAPKARMYMFRASRCIGSKRENGVAMIRDAQTAVAEANPRIEAGMNTDELGPDFRRDGCHFNSMGRREVVARAAPDLLKLHRRAD